MTIGYAWGEVVGVELGSLESGDLRIGRVCIRIKAMGFFNKEIKLRVNNLLFKCQIVKEIVQRPEEGGEKEKVFKWEETRDYGWWRRVANLASDGATREDDDVAVNTSFPCLGRIGNSAGGFIEMDFTGKEGGVRDLGQVHNGTEERLVSEARGLALRGDGVDRKEGSSPTEWGVKISAEASGSIFKETQQDGMVIELGGHTLRETGIQGLDNILMIEGKDGSSAGGQRSTVMGTDFASAWKGLLRLTSQRDEMWDDEDATSSGSIGFVCSDCGPALRFKGFNLVVDLGLGPTTVNSPFSLGPPMPSSSKSGCDVDKLLREEKSAVISSQCQSHGSSSKRTDSCPPEVVGSRGLLRDGG
ncbi:hypothetical protein Dimus_003003 [Dionaea muscipula]